MLYVVRHAKAGSRHDFAGDDRMRPLSPTGNRQAKALAPTLVAAGVRALISSPFLRCIETLQPTARALDGAVAIDECLSEGHAGFELVELLSRLHDWSAVCSHGDVIPEAIAVLERRGCQITSAPDWRKGSVWVIDRTAGGEFATAHAWPPPDITA